ncbi:MAG: CoA-binding protein [Candidatus Zixiibacteriota bacterium]
MDDNIRSFLNARGIAVVGVSSSRIKFGTSVFRTLKKNKYSVYPVNPNLRTFDGDRCFGSLTDLRGKVDAAVVVVKPEKALDVVEQAEKAGVLKLWFQQGADFSLAASRAQRSGISVVRDKCILMYAEPVTGIHRFHRFLAKLFKKY